MIVADKGPKMPQGINSCRKRYDSNADPNELRGLEGIPVRARSNKLVVHCLRQRLRSLTMLGEGVERLTVVAPAGGKQELRHFGPHSSRQHRSPRKLICI